MAKSVLFLVALCVLASSVEGTGGTEKWAFETGCERVNDLVDEPTHWSMYRCDVWSSPAVGRDDATVFIWAASEWQKLHAIDTVTGMQKWSWDLRESWDPRLTGLECSFDSFPAVSKDGASVFVGAWRTCGNVTGNWRNHCDQVRHGRLPVGVYAVFAFDALTGTIKWMSPFDTENAVIGFAVSNDTVFAGSPYDARKIVALDALNGTQKWSFAAASIPTVSNDGATVFATGDPMYTVYAIDASNGTQKWSFRITEDGCSPFTPTVSNNGYNVFVACTGSSTVYALDALNGTQKWSFQRGGGGTDKCERASGQCQYKNPNDPSFGTYNYTDYFNSGEPVGTSHSPAVSNDDATVFVGSADKKVYALDALNGTLKWTFDTADTGGAVRATPTVSRDGATVFVGSTDKKVYALDAMNGTQKWSFETGSAVLTPLTVSNDGATVFVAPVRDKKRVYALCSGSGLCPTTGTSSTTSTASTPSTTSASTPAPLAKAPTDTKHFVEVAVTMPYTVDEFKTAAVKTPFKKAVATAAGTVPENVVIVSVKSARRRSSSVVVQTKILAKDAAAVDTMKTTLGSGDALKTKLNTALKKEGLKESTGVTAPATGSTAARSTASTAQMLVAALSLAVFARM